MRVITRGTLKISRAICAAMMVRLSSLVRPAQADDADGRVRVAIGGLPVATGVDQRGGRQVDPVGPFGDLLAALVKDPGQVGVPEEAVSSPQADEDLQCLKLVEDVFPDVWLAGAAVNNAMSINPAVERQ